MTLRHTCADFKARTAQAQLRSELFPADGPCEFATGIKDHLATGQAVRPSDADHHHNRQLALDVAHAGQPVFPCAQASKRPLTPRGFCDATTDPAKIMAWWRQHPGALVGLPTGAFWVLDLDAPIAVSVYALCAVLRREWPEIESRCGLIVASPGAGLHLYWGRTPDLAIRTAAGEIGKSIDTRGHAADGKPTGYIIGPGNVLPDGRSYRVQRGSLDDLPEAPRRLLALAAFCKRGRARITADAGLAAALRDAEPGAWRDEFDQHEESRLPPRVPLTALDAEPMRRQALADLESEAQRLAGMRDGRRDGIFIGAARLARYASNHVLAAGEIETAMLEAWSASGAAAVHGVDYPREAIRRALEKGRNDPLPPLARQFRMGTIGKGGR